VVFGVGAPLSYRRVLAPDSFPHTGSRRVTFDEVTLSHTQGQGVADAVLTPLHAPPTPAPAASIPTHLVTVRQWGKQPYYRPAKGELINGLIN